MTHYHTPAKHPSAALDQAERSCGPANGAIACAVVFLCAVAFSFHLASFQHAKEAVLLAGLLPLACTASQAAVRRGLATFAPLWWGLIFSALVSALRAPVTSYVVEESGRIALLLFTGALLFGALEDAVWRGRVLDAVLASTVAVAALGYLQYADLLEFLLPATPGYTQPIYSVFGNQDMLGGYLAIGMALALRRAPHGARYARWLAIGACGFMSGALVLSGSRSAWLAAACGLAFVVVSHALAIRRRGEAIAWEATVALSLALVAIAACACCVLCWTWPAPYVRVLGSFGEGDVGGRARLWFWNGALRMVAHAPLLGAGLGQFDYLAPRFLGDALAAPGGERLYYNELHTEHPHSEPLSILAETGLAGALFWGWMLWRLARTRGSEHGALAALGIFCLFNAGLHSFPHALAGLVLASRLMGRNEQAPAVEWNGKFSMVAALAIVVLRVWTVLAPSVLLARAEDRHVARVDPSAEYGAALAYPWPNYLAREEFAMWRMDYANEADAAWPLLEVALRGIDTGRIHLLAGECLLRLGRKDEARMHLAACLHRWPWHERALGGLKSITPPDMHGALVERARRFERLP